jgi:hypothetical protein
MVLDLEMILLVVMLGFVIASSILHIIEHRSLGKITGHAFDNYFIPLFYFPVYLIFIFALLSDSKNYVSHIRTFSMLMLLFEPVGIHFFVENRERKQLPTEKSKGLLNSHRATPLIFIIIYLLFILSNYLNKSMLISSKAYAILLYLFHILARVLLWTWRWKVESVDRYTEIL